jgi:hypothetical protein
MLNWLNEDQKDMPWTSLDACERARRLGDTIVLMEKDSLAQFESNISNEAALT